MNDGYAWWLILVGIAIGVAVSWLLIVRLPRGESDIVAAERRREAEWISDSIERHGGVAPLALVDEILELHQAYLRSPGLLGQEETRPWVSPPPGGPPPRPPLPPVGPPPGGLPAQGPPPATPGWAPPPSR